MYIYTFVFTESVTGIDYSRGTVSNLNDEDDKFNIRAGSEFSYNYDITDYSVKIDA